MNAGPLLLGRVVSGPVSARATIDGREYINFAGTGYLALGRRDELRRAAMRVIMEGSAFSRQIPHAYGSVDPEIRDCEAAAAAYCGTEAAVYFASGYLTGGALLTLTDTVRSVLFIDESAHYCLVDAARLTGRPVIPFAHCDTDSLRAAIKRELVRGCIPLVITDGVFATTGRLSPLGEYAAAIAEYDGRLAVDEAHAFGVIGAHGRGAAEFLGVESIAMSAATLSKAFCSHGGIIGCDATTATMLNRSPPLRGANSGSPLSAAVAAASIRCVMNEPEIRDRLAALTAYLRRRLRETGVVLKDDSPAPIVAFTAGDHRAMGLLQRRLFDGGIHLMLSNYIGAGPEGLLRCTVYADHSEDDIEELIGALQRS